MGVIVNRGASETLFDSISTAAPLVYFSLDEASGTTAVNYGSLGSPANGLYKNSPSLAQTAAPGGTLAPNFDGTNDYVDIYSAALAGGFNGQLGSIALWMKVSSAATWLDRTTDITFTLMADASNYISFQKRSSNQNYIRVYYNAAGTLKNIECLLANPGWYFVVITWDKANNQLKLYINGTQWASTVTGLGTWAGSLASTKCNIAEYAPASGLPWKGSLAHFAVWDRAITELEVSNIYSKGSSVVSLPAPSGEAAVMFTFDDGVDSLYSTAYPIFSAAGKKMTAYIITSVLDTAGYITTAQAQEMSTAGMDISVHGHTHTIYTSLTQAEIETDISTAVGIIEAAGMTRASKHAAYPFGGYDADVVAAMVAQSMLTGRVADYGYMDLAQIHDTITPLRCPVVVVDAANTYGTLKSMVDEAKANNQKVSFLFHSVSGAETTKLQAIVDYCIAQGLPFLSISDWWALYDAVY